MNRTYVPHGSVQVPNDVVAAIERSFNSTPNFWDIINTGPGDPRTGDPRT